MKLAVLSQVLPAPKPTQLNSLVERVDTLKDFESLCISSCDGWLYPQLLRYSFALFLDTKQNFVLNL